MKILLAEDDADARTLLTDIIVSAGAGFEFIAVENGVQAFASLEANPDVALAIADVEMPEMDGLQWLARVRGDQRFSRLPVIMCTGTTDRGTVAQAVALGVTSYLLKPYTRSAVLDKVLQIVRPRRSVVTGLGDVDAARARLGVDREAHRELLEHHVRVADLWVSDAQRARRFAHLRALAVRLVTLRQLSADLAANLLTERCQEAEEWLTKIVSPPPPVELAALLAKIDGAAKTIQPEVARLRATLTNGF